ncbi:hypothetical protein A3E49_03320 [Candidatus Saccharibacteria bacterium RIFCSPHIGHO2_12_FULL_49_19]|nr:MAG: hypothetical protein A2708_01620 [Candidatus Saccharibacteria bacterium RIFCSPHIGHO2_01_FULL_49_21]OGL36946.1 MAG: hypothetical protein A3E49_03320 [Candidatus Saccharibacteria bacterium RIFCSPHIGHO2_12_FULL_49_19]
MRAPLVGRGRGSAAFGSYQEHITWAWWPTCFTPRDDETILLSKAYYFQQEFTLWWVFKFVAGRTPIALRLPQLSLAARS